MDVVVPMSTSSDNILFYSQTGNANSSKEVCVLKQPNTAVVFVLPQTKKLTPNNFSGYKSMGKVKSETENREHGSGLCT